MVQVKEETAIIESKVIMSDNDLYRYLLTRTWEVNKPKATVIMLNPSKANMLKTDKTIMNVTNYLIENDYGSMTIVNLFAYMATDPKFLSQRDEAYESINNGFLIEAFENSDVIIIAWTRDNYKTRKKEVIKLLGDYQRKVKCFQDSEGRKPRHPRDLGDKWTLVDYEFDE